MTSLSTTLSNDTIRFATEIPEGSPFVSLGRQIRILGPAQLLGFLIDPNIQKEIPELISLLDSLDKDWAANLFLYAITGRDALPLIGIENSIHQWRTSQKEVDMRYWKKWWTENQGRLIWDGSHLIPKSQNEQ